MKAVWRGCLKAAVLLLAAIPVLAHHPSDSYLTLRAAGTRLTGEWHLALRDLEECVGLDANGDGQITWAELRAAETTVQAYARAHLSIRDSLGKGELRMTSLLVDRHSDGTYAVLQFGLVGLEQPGTLEVRYHALFDLDPTHRGLLRLEGPHGSHLAVFSPEAPVQRFTLNLPAASRWASFLHEGVWHIWTGYDHLLFLIALLLPGVLRRHGPVWEPQPTIGPVIRDAVKTVSAFTLAHSITLTLAALGWVQLPPRIVESVIAGSVLVAAANNLQPFLTGRTWLVAFAFGLIHGFGFANALVDLGLSGGSLASTLLAFNLGVEAGQMAIVALFLPLALGLRARPFYRDQLVPFGSAAIGVLAVAWLAERAFDWRWLP
jgi:hypothetical protein